MVDEALKELVPTFLKNKMKALLVAEQALSDQNYPEVRRFGHNLKGDSPPYGFNELSVLGEKLENLAKADSVNPAELKTALNEIRNHLEKYSN